MSMSFIAVFTPALALLLGFVLRHERPTGWGALGAALILGGVLLAVTRDQKSPVNNLRT
ncbi:MAG: hypothetical protein ACLQU4_20295 [Limisphaerales bacterium]